MTALPMEIRGVSVDRREITGTVVPYDEISYLAPDPNGERVRRNAFAKSIDQRGDKILLFRNHEHRQAVGRAKGFAEQPDGLTATFEVRTGPVGDEVLEEVRDGYLSGLSIGFRTIQAGRVNGVREIREAALLEVSLVAIPVYDAARIVSVRAAQLTDELMAVFRATPPEVDLSPIPPLWG